MSKDVVIGKKKINQLEVKLFLTSGVLLELLDETEGQSRFKHKLRHHITGLQKELDKVLGVDMRGDDGLSIFITDAMNALEQHIDDSLSE